MSAANGKSSSPLAEEKEKFTAVLHPIDPLPQRNLPLPSFTPLVTVIDFHHARGPEVESWFGVQEGFDPAVEYNWDFLPFMALSDGAHASEEDFSYFTLLKPKKGDEPATSLFGMSCTRQIDSTLLINRPADVTRSTVQKAIVVIADSPQYFGVLRERLGMIAHAWFAQREFTDTEILKRFQESLADEKTRLLLKEEAERGHYLGTSLRELIHTFKAQTLVLFKCCLLQPKMLFFGSSCDKLCMIQFALVSLIPGLIRHLQDAADPELNNCETMISTPKRLESNSRSSLLSFMGLPLQIFGKGSLFGPYTPLQQLDMLADFGTKSYLVGSTNSLLLQQKDKYSDILINLDDDTINITSPSLKAALQLTHADRRWIDFLYQEVHDTWDPANPSRPKNMQYAGSEEFIRSQFEAYVIGLLSSTKVYEIASPEEVEKLQVDHDDELAIDYGHAWVEAWFKTENFRIWNKHTDRGIITVAEPKHPMSGGLTMDDVQRRLAEQVKDLHLDERLAQGREMLGRNLAVGKERASSMFNKLYSDVEYLRESQRRRAEDAAKAKAENPPSEKSAGASQPVDLAKVQQTAAVVGTKASAYMSSWATWAGEKRKQGGWASGWGKKNSKGDEDPKSTASAASGASSPIDKDYQFVNTPKSRETATPVAAVAEEKEPRPTTGQSFGESILSGVSESPVRPDTGKADAKQSSTEDNGFQKEAVTGHANSPKIQQEVNEEQDKKKTVEESVADEQKS